ncbi:MAG: hypothetical protein Q4D76_16615 [Oscillospiraceae bacterium]|nr:hypothetical protein [Oscillospiraceae bacterium]
MKALIKRIAFELNSIKYTSFFPIDHKPGSFQNPDDYCGPLYSCVKKITVPKTTQCIGSLIADGRLYCCPANGGQIMMYDLKNKSFSFGSTISSGPLLFSGIGKYGNNIYCFPRRANSIVVHDRINNTTREIDLRTKYHQEHHYCGVITSEGVAYQPPRNTNHILKIDLNKFSVEKVDISFPKAKIRYSGIIYHPNGYIYMIPEYNGKIIVLDPKTDKFRYIGPFWNDCRAVGPTVGCDGNIYAALIFSKGILKIDVQKNEVSIIQPSVHFASYGLESVNSKLISFPSYTDGFYEVDLAGKEVHEIGTVDRLSEKAECAGASVDENGDIYVVPCYGENIYVLKKNSMCNINYTYDNSF